MAYKFGQIRRPQIKLYSRKLSYLQEYEKRKSEIPNTDILFLDTVLNLSGTNQLIYVSDDGLKRRNYYLRFKVYKMWEGGSQSITIQLVNTLKTTDNTQTLETITVEKGDETDYSIYDIIIPPNANYNQIKFILNRNLIDYNTEQEVRDDGTVGRISKIEIMRYEEINNVIDTLNDSIEQKGMLKQIGIQGAPGMQICIDGEQIRIGRSGIYEINNGVTVKFLGFILEENDGKYFILDYQY